MNDNAVPMPSSSHVLAASEAARRHLGIGYVLSCPTVRYL